MWLKQAGEWGTGTYLKTLTLFLPLDIAEMFDSIQLWKRKHG